MSLSHSPKVVTDGLVLYLDAANQRSYPKSGTTWSDLKGSNNGTLTNGPTFNGVNGGVIEFDGTNQYAAVPHDNIFNFGTNDFSIMTNIYWKYSSSTDKCIVEFRGSNSNSLSSWVWFINSQNKMQVWKPNLATQSSTVLSVNNWYNLTIIRSSGTLYYFVNSLQAGSSAWNSSADADSSGIRLGTRQDTTNSLNADMSNLSIYNRALTGDEVRQNYLATRGRYK
jgi:hypothetical protein